MEDSFRVRLDKAFGSLAYSTAVAPPSSSPSSLWCLTDQEIPRNPRNRDKVKLGPESGADLGFQEDMVKELEDLDEEEEEEEEEEEKENEESRGKPKRANYNDEEWDIKNSIGLDCTLDYEEEEDEYDKVAVAKDKPEDCLFMSEVADYEIDIDSGTVLPSSLKDVARDPRANHMAARIRLKEDAETATKMDSFWVSSSVVNKKIHLHGDDTRNSILKKKDEHHTCYTLDKARDVDEETNGQAYSDFLQMMKKPNGMGLGSDDPSLVPLMPVTFIPKKRNCDTAMVDDAIQSNKNGDDSHKEEAMHRQDLPLGIAAGDIHGGETCSMEEDEPEMIDDRNQRSSRQYRVRPKWELQ